MIVTNRYECHDQLRVRFDSMSHLQTVFAGSLSQAILEDTEGELERKFENFGSEYSTDLDISQYCFWKFFNFWIF